MNCQSDKLHRPAPRGFTLLELMVSIALVLILILGINQVFKIASDTVNVGQAMSGADRENRAIQGTMFPDVQNSVLTGAPYFIIRSRIQPAFRNRADELADKDGDPSTVDIDGNNTEGESKPGEIISATTYNSRNHRLDRLNFFASYRYRRQTGTGGQLLVDFSSNEANIVYGHLDQPGTVTAPGSPVFTAGQADVLNTNNRYATQWILGRSVILLNETAGLPAASWKGGDYVVNNAGSLSPLAFNSKSKAGKNFQDSTVDVAQTSMVNFRNKILDPRNWGSTGQGWFDTVSWFRFKGYTYPTRPLTSDGMARTLPIFVNSCTQFIVEYAGDYLNQDPFTSEITSTVYSPGGTDGVVDFIIVPVPGSPGVPGARRTRWYGLPRNVDLSDDQVARKPTIKGTGQVRGMLDVVPLRDVLKSVGVNPPVDFFERDMDNRVPNSANYADVRAKALPIRNGVGGASSPIAGTDLTEYCAAWGPDELAKGAVPNVKPKMLRITIVVDDPAGRMTEGQTYEYVFTLP